MEKIAAVLVWPGKPGVTELAPPLVDSEWVNGSVERLVRIVLHGAYGPISVAGKKHRLDMPGFGAALDDVQVAAVLTYLRREWEHAASPVAPDAVHRIRATTTSRRMAWTEEELKELP